MRKTKKFDDMENPLSSESDQTANDFFEFLDSLESQCEALAVEESRKIRMDPARSFPPDDFRKTVYWEKIRSNVTPCFPSEGGYDALREIHDDTIDGLAEMCWWTNCDCDQLRKLHENELASLEKAMAILREVREDVIPWLDSLGEDRKPKGIWASAPPRLKDTATQLSEIVTDSLFEELGVLHELWSIPSAEYVTAQGGGITRSQEAQAVFEYAMLRRLRKKGVLIADDVITKENGYRFISVLLHFSGIPEGKSNFGPAAVKKRIEREEKRPRGVLSQIVARITRKQPGPKPKESPRRG